MSRKKSMPQPQWHKYDRVHITDHAAEEFIDEGLGEFDMFRAEEVMRGLLKVSRPVQPRKGFHVRALVNNKFRGAEYRFANGWIFVIYNNSVLTTYKNTADFTWFGGKSIGKKGE